MHCGLLIRAGKLATTTDTKKESTELYLNSKSSEVFWGQPYILKRTVSITFRVIVAVNTIKCFIAAWHSIHYPGGIGWQTNQTPNGMTKQFIAHVFVCRAEWLIHSIVSYILSNYSSFMAEVRHVFINEASQRCFVPSTPPRTGKSFFSSK